MAEGDDGQGDGNFGHAGFRSQRDLQRQQEISFYEEELSRLDDSHPYARNALELEIHRLRGGVMDMIDVINSRKCKVRCRIAIPQDQFPGINFVGKLLGQGGTTLKKLQEECNVKMAILGRGSMRDQQKEIEAFESGDPKYQHLKQPLHLQIDCLDAPEEAYYRISRAVYEAKTLMTPDPNELAAAAAAAAGYGAPGPYGPPPPVGGDGFHRGGGGFRGRGGRGGGRGRGGGPPQSAPPPYDDMGGGYGGVVGYEGEADASGGRGGYRGGSRGGPRGGGGPRGDFSGGRGGGFRGRGGRGGGGGDNGHGGGGFGQDYGQSQGGGKSSAPRGRGGPSARRPHPYARGN